MVMLLWVIGAHFRGLVCHRYLSIYIRKHQKDIIGIGIRRDRSVAGVWVISPCDPMAPPSIMLMPIFGRLATRRLGTVTFSISLDLLWLGKYCTIFLSLHIYLL
jgi:hypothetical protein